MSAQHTPGPWGTLEDDCFQGCHYIPVEQPSSGRLICDVRDDPDALTDEDRANARLIAAAPDLLDALEAVQPYFEGEHHADHPHCKMIAAAIAKARGGA